MGWCDGEVAEEGAVLVFADEIEGVIHNDVVGVSVAGASTFVAGKFEFF